MEENEVVTPAEEVVVAEEVTETPAEEVSGEAVDAAAAKLETAVEKALAAHIAKMDVPAKKSLGIIATPSLNSMPKEERLKNWLVAARNEDFAGMKQFGGAIEKSAMTTTNTSAVVPPAEFIAEVYRVQDEYGVARRNCTVRSTNRSSIETIIGGNDPYVYTTQESGVKRTSRPTYTPFTLNFKKFTAVVPLSEELQEESAIDLWNDITTQLARTYSLIEDQLVFTDMSSGILYTMGVNIVPTPNSSPTSITFDRINDMIYGIPTSGRRGGKFYMHPTILGAIQKIKDNDGAYIWRPGPDGIDSGTIWGYGYETVDAMPEISLVGPGQAFMVFGNLKNTILADRTGLQVKVFDSGLVGDPDDDMTNLNLMTQDLVALRSVKRMNAKTLVPEGYSVLMTPGIVS